MSDRPTHDDIIRRVEANGAHAAEIFHAVNARLGDIFQIIENLEVTTDRIDARVEKVEAKVLKYDLMGARIVGALGAFAVAASALWWLVKDKVAAMFGVTGS